MIASLIAVTVLAVQTPAAPKDTPVVTAIRAGTLIDGTGAAPMKTFTSVRVVGTAYFNDLALRNAINAGWLPGPRIAVRYMVKYGADVIKICATGGVLSATDSAGAQQYSEEEMRAIVETARMLSRRVAAHAHGTAGIEAPVRAGVTSIEHGSILDSEAVALMVQHGTWLVPTLMAGEQVSQLAQAGRLPPAVAAKALAIAPRMQVSFRLALQGGPMQAIQAGTLSVVGRSAAGVP